jgi:hypothetical protein
MAAVDPLEDYELLTEGKYLGVQRCAGSESLSDRREQREDDRETWHRQTIPDAVQIQLVQRERSFW